MTGPLLKQALEELDLQFKEFESLYNLKHIRTVARSPRQPLEDRHFERRMLDPRFDCWNPQGNSKQVSKASKTGN